MISSHLPTTSIWVITPRDIPQHAITHRNSILEDSRSGELNVLSSDREFAVRLEATPTELKGGGTVYFTIKAWNFASDGLNIQFHLVNESGKVVYPKDGGWVSKFVPKGAGNYSLNAFSLGVHGIGMHKYTVIARISGEEEKSTVTVEVEPTNGTKLEQVSAECSDIHFDFRNSAYRATLTCKVYLYNPLEKGVKVRDITVLQNYSLGDLERFFNIPLVNVPTGSLSVGKWNINPESFSLASQGTETVTFSLPMEISSWIPVSVSDAAQVTGKDGEYTKVSFIYTLGYTYDGSNWKQFEGHVSDYVPVTMDAKTVAADYMLSGAMAYVSAWTLLKVPSEFKVKVKGVEFNPVGVFLGIVLYYGKGKILETLANWWG